MLFCFVLLWLHFGLVLFWCSMDRRFKRVGVGVGAVVHEYIWLLALYDRNIIFDYFGLLYLDQITLGPY